MSLDSVNLYRYVSPQSVADDAIVEQPRDETHGGYFLLTVLRALRSVRPKRIYHHCVICTIRTRRVSARISRDPLGTHSPDLSSVRSSGETIHLAHQLPFIRHPIETDRSIWRGLDSLRRRSRNIYGTRFFIPSSSLLRSNLAIPRQ